MKNFKNLFFTLILSFYMVALLSPLTTFAMSSSDFEPGNDNFVILFITGLVLSIVIAFIVNLIEVIKDRFK